MLKDPGSGSHSQPPTVFVWKVNTLPFAGDPSYTTEVPTQQGLTVLNWVDLDGMQHIILDPGSNVALRVDQVPEEEAEKLLKAAAERKAKKAVDQDLDKSFRSH